MELVLIVSVGCFICWFIYIFKGTFKPSVPNVPVVEEQGEKSLDLEEHLATIEQSIKEEDYAYAKSVCDVICKYCNDSRVYHYLFSINLKLGNPQVARNNILSALGLIDPDSEEYLLTLKEAIDIMFQCGDLDGVIRGCDSFNEKNSADHQMLAQQVDHIYKDCLIRRAKRDEIIERYNNGSIKLSEMIELFISAGAYSDASPWLLDTDTLGELVQLELSFKVCLAIGDSYANELAYDLYEKQVKTHLVYQSMHSYSIELENDQLAEDVLSKYCKDFGNSSEYKAFYSAVV
jgi:hypothetical protein